MLADRRGYNAQLMYELEVVKPGDTLSQPLALGFSTPDDSLLEDEERLAELYQEYLEGEEDELANVFDDDLDLQAVQGIWL